MSLVVSDTSPLRALAHLGRLDIPAALFRELLIPEAVVAELHVPVPGSPSFNAHNVPGARIVAVQDRKWAQQLFERLGGMGEAEAIVVTVEVRAQYVLIDDAAARAVAEGVGARPLGC